MNEDSFFFARELLRDVTPLWHDCGAYCGAACCRAEDNEENGVFLFPGEAERIGERAWARIVYRNAPELGRTPMLLCDGTCERAHRPLGCRIFPLSPFYGEDGRLDVKIDRRSWAVCPLAGHGIRGLNPEFVAAVREALRMLDAEAEFHDFLTRWSALEAVFARDTL